jgi:hypothetical protein
VRVYILGYEIGPLMGCVVVSFEVQCVRCWRVGGDRGSGTVPTISDGESFSTVSFSVGVIWPHPRSLIGEFLAGNRGLGPINIFSLEVHVRTTCTPTMGSSLDQGPSEKLLDATLMSGPRSCA